MNVLTLSSLWFNVDAGVDFSARNNGQVSIYVECEGSETADVHTLTSSEVVIKVGDEGSPDNQHLGFSFNWLLDVNCAFCGVQVLSRVLISMFENPKN